MGVLLTYSLVLIIGLGAVIGASIGFAWQLCYSEPRDRREGE